MSVEDAPLQIGSDSVVDSAPKTVDPDIWPNSSLPDFMLPQRDWKQHYADVKSRKQAASVVIDQAKPSVANRTEYG